jgi:hypothetical protein
MLVKVRETLKKRLNLHHPRRRNGALTKASEAAALDFLCGAACVIDALGLDNTHSLTGPAFLMSIRGAEEFIKG